jgi:preprotein translocase subunit SecE
MENKVINNKTALDKLLVIISAAIILGSVIFYNSYPMISALIRTLIILAGIGLSIIVLYQSRTGKDIWEFILSARVELRKIIWPSRQETTQMTIVVVVFTFIMSIFFWALDMFLLWATRLLTGQGV